MVDKWPFQEKRHQENCCTEVLLPLSSSEGVCVDFTLEMKFMFHFSSSLLKHSSCPVHGRGAGSGWCLLWKDASQQGQTGELAIWWQVYCFVNGVGNMVSSLMFIAHNMSFSHQCLKDCFLFQFELDTSKVKANWDSVLLQANIPPAYQWSIIGESESDNLV